MWARPLSSGKATEVIMETRHVNYLLGMECFSGNELICLLIVILTRTCN